MCCWRPPIFRDEVRSTEGLKKKRVVKEKWLIFSVLLWFYVFFFLFVSCKKRLLLETEKKKGGKNGCFLLSVVCSLPNQDSALYYAH